MKAKKLFPVPEAIAGEKWSISEGRPQADCKERVMYVPTNGSKQAVFLRAHETAHARITPKMYAKTAMKRYGISMEAMQCCEDLRVHTFLERRDVERPGSIDRDSIGKMVEMLADDHRMLASLLVASHRTDEYEDFVVAIQAVDHGDTIIHAAESLCSFFDNVVKTVRGKRYYGKSRDPLSDPRGFRDCTVPTARLFDTLFPPEGGVNKDGAKVTEYCNKFRKREGETVPWGRLGPVQKARLSLTRKTKGGGGKCWRDEGSVPKSPYRLILDGRIFALKKREKGGTVLVDASGSMSLSQEDLRSIVEAAPGATVAAYCGREDFGRLVIVAERGRMATGAEMHSNLHLGGNIVDGPALRWLAKMPAPRIWVSDGMVTGCHDRGAPSLIHECMATCRSASVVRVDRADAVAGLLKAQR